MALIAVEFECLYTDQIPTNLGVTSEKVRGFAPNLLFDQEIRVLKLTNGLVNHIISILM